MGSCATGMHRRGIGGVGDQRVIVFEQCVEDFRPCGLGARWLMLGRLRIRIYDGLSFRRFGWEIASGEQTSLHRRASQRVARLRA